MAQEEPINTFEAIMDHVAQGHDPAGDRRPIRVDSLGYLLPPPPRAGFRANIAVVAGGSGFAVELVPGAGIRCFVHSVFLTKPTVSITTNLIKNSTASTGGTSTNGAKIPTDSQKPASGTLVKLFTAIPTAGTAVGTLALCVLDPTDWMQFIFGADGEPPLVLHGPSETLAVNVSAAATIAGFIAWSEEQL